jgi:hypothetical protein
VDQLTIGFLHRLGGQDHPGIGGREDQGGLRTLHGPGATPASVQGSPVMGEDTTTLANPDTTFASLEGCGHRVNDNPAVDKTPHKRGWGMTMATLARHQ